MKVWQKIAEIEGIESANLEQVNKMLSEENTCAAYHECDYQLVGKAKFKRFCDLGCGVECLKEYLELEVKNK